MKKLLTLLALIVIFLPLITSANLSLGSGLIGYWPLDARDGLKNGIAADRSGGGINGRLTNSPSIVLGKIGQALSFNGSNQYVVVPTPNYNSTNWTISTWVYSTADQPSFTALVYSRDTLPNSPGLGIGYGNSGAVNQLGFQWQGGNEYQLDSTLIIPNGQWVFVALTITASSQTLYMHTSSGLSTHNFSVTETSLALTGDLDLGNDTCCVPRSLNGKMDDVRVYNRALSSQEINQLYRSEAGIHQGSFLGGLLEGMGI